MKTTTPRFKTPILEMKAAIIECLTNLEKGYGLYKQHISTETEIPIDILTVLLKQLKNEGKIELIMIWSEETCRPNGSGYCLTGKTIF